MRIATLTWALALTVAMSLTGCVHDGTRQQVADDLTQSESQVFPDQAVWMGDDGGYHYIRVRSIYSCMGDSDLKIPVSQWTLADPFALTDNASQWRNVQWQDKEMLVHSRFAYVLLDARVHIDPSATQMAQTQEAMSQPATSTAETLPAGPTTQPSTKP